MWKWIAKQRKNGRRGNACYFKVEWLKKHGIEEDEIQSGCFFCEHAERYYGKSRYGEFCDFCPAAKIDPTFKCVDGGKYNYHKPQSFYKKLVSLNKIRLARKK